MARMPIEIVTIGGVSAEDVSRAVCIANRLQSEFHYSVIDAGTATDLQLYAHRSTEAQKLLGAMEACRVTLPGYHPFLVAVTDSELQGKIYGNLFGSDRAEKGVAAFTIANVPDVIIPQKKLNAYYLYYLARYALSFLTPDKKNHDDSRDCVFDRKISKRDIVKSMRRRAICDNCRDELISFRAVSVSQVSALDEIFAAAGETMASEDDPKPRVFIGSSVEGLDIANKIQELLAYDAAAVVWNQNTVFGLGESTLEALEKAVLEYDYAIFVFTPDDELTTRGATKAVARDNVLFELGLFIGRLGRSRAFVVNPGRGSISLPSDLHGITTATYDPTQRDMAARLGPACNRIRETLRQNAKKGV
ncbi:MULTISPECIES: TIR domain-containing protein [Sorangium]|uniref:TIR domain-containing protein n=1 Tax=Sorangium TaxID=39643 RepID=UPI003D9C21EC